MSLDPSRGTASHTSMSLLRAAQANDHDAWRRIVDLYSRRIYRWTRQAGLKPDDASDVVQEVFRAVARKLVDFEHIDGKDSFRGWLRRITQNKLRDYFGHRPGRLESAAGGTNALRLMSELPEKESESSTGSSSRRCSKKSGIDPKILRQIQADVSERDWSVFWRVVVDGQTTTEAGAEFHMTSNAVRLVKMRILRRLRGLMDGTHSESHGC
jgi:RNA polymerase sigma-70 factor, ECF subfamily